jgi:hypothetical protein
MTVLITMLGGRVRACLRRRRSPTGCSRTWQSGRLRRTSRTLSPSTAFTRAAAWATYLQWYLPRTRTRVTYVPATPPPPPAPDHDRVLPDATYPVRRDQTTDTAVSYDTENILHS